LNSGLQSDPVEQCSSVVSCCMHLPKICWFLLHPDEEMKSVSLKY